ncbi:type II toxin-antitoxin system VapC family toxin [Nocardioides sp. Kera G14]|uniref:type II toxin-antitoxin system VapC family toxin n=1 Tax=Nocardioides sp. Kera G14 TaxID=2884264 RepID=UPI001D122A31|nr:type II toxin-antitoxin system VapC family toxin [Nocardioides sp. Kera G14]UDY23548.1 type II toxin-antitoxin system VapC family toxin [Nocardioides sp. Kera G14]
MKLVDVNVLVYARDSQSPHHRAAKHWLDSALSGSTPVGFSWLVLIGFVRLVTHPRVMASPLTPAEAMATVDAWLAARSAQVLHPGQSHARLMAEMLSAVGVGGNLTNDAHLAALALEHRAAIVSFDSDFERFPGVRWEKPR